MAKNKVRKKKHTQTVPVPEYLIHNYNGKPMRVKNPNWKPGKTKLIKHKPQIQSSAPFDPPIDGGLGMEADGG